MKLFFFPVVGATEMQKLFSSNKLGFFNHCFYIVFHKLDLTGHKTTVGPQKMRCIAVVRGKNYAATKENI